MWLVYSLSTASSAGEDAGFFEKLYTYVINNIQVCILRSMNIQFFLFEVLQAGSHVQSSTV